VALLACASLTLAGCHHAVTDPTDPKFIVAEKPGEWTITRAELDKTVNAFLKDKNATADQVGPDKMLVLETALLNQMVTTKLILARAATLSFPDVDKEADQQLQAFKDQMPPGTDFDAKLKEAGVTIDEVKKNVRDHVLIAHVIKAEALKDDEPSDQQINDFYLQHKEQFVTDPKVRASRVVVLVDPTTSPADKAAKKKKIDDARARVAKGEDFAKVASDVSEDRYSAAQGGDIGFFSPGQNEAGFDDVAFTTKLNQVSPVFETPMGYEFLKVTDQHPSTQLTQAEAHSIIANGLRQQTDEQEVGAYTKKLLDNGGVTFHIARIDPSAQQAPAGGTQAPAPDNSAPAPQPPAPAGN
jgi:parvulin-like peptidyl-prolyl isomerase